MKNIGKSVFAAVKLIVVLLLFVLGACNKHPDEIGLSLIESEQLYVGSDTTFIVTAWSKTDDSVRTDGSSKSLLGTMISNTFGLTEASIYTQIRLSVLSPDFGTNPVVDSAVLNFVYAGYYGNILTQQHLTVYRVTEDFYADSVYYSNATFDYDSLNKLAEMDFVPQPEQEIDSLDIPGLLRIPLNENFYQPFISALGSDTLADNDLFVKFFKGLYIKSNLNPSWSGSIGAILYFNLLDENSNVVIYYHNDSLDSLKYNFYINPYCARVGHFSHNYTMSNDPLFKQTIVDGDTTTGTERLYLQSMGGVKTKLKFPGLKEWADGNTLSINEAKLILPVHQGIEEYNVPSSLVLFIFDEDGNFDLPPDASEGEGFYGGRYLSNINAYQYRLTYYIQELLNGKPDNGLVLYPTAKSITANGVELSGTSPSLDRPIILKITYTKLN